jgi:hypothetical protein
LVIDTEQYNIQDKNDQIKIKTIIQEFMASLESD